MRPAPWIQACHCFSRTRGLTWTPGGRKAEGLAGPAVTPARTPFIMHMCVWSGIFTEGPLRAGLGATAACGRRPGAVGSARRRFLPVILPVWSPQPSLRCCIECHKPWPRANVWRGDLLRIREGFSEEVPHSFMYLFIRQLLRAYSEPDLCNLYRGFSSDQSTVPVLTYLGVQEKESRPPTNIHTRMHEL